MNFIQLLRFAFLCASITCSLHTMAQTREPANGKDIMLLQWNQNTGRIMAVTKGDGSQVIPTSSREPDMFFVALNTTLQDLYDKGWSIATSTTTAPGPGQTGETTTYVLQRERKK